MKFKVFGYIFVWLFVSTYIISAFALFDVNSVGVINDIQETGVSDGGYGSQALSMWGTFTSILSFQVSGLPSIAVILLFQTPTAILGYIVIDVLKDLIPFT